jgi:hypothetical protein
MDKELEDPYHQVQKEEKLHKIQVKILIKHPIILLGVVKIII